MTTAPQFHCKKTPQNHEEGRVRVLQVYPRLLCGGIEKVMENIVANAEKDRFIHEILTQEEGEYEEPFLRLGVTIHRIPYDGNPASYRRRVSELLRERGIDAVHCHMHYEMNAVCRAAKEAGVKVRIVHSHIAHPDWPAWKRVLRIPKFLLHDRYATHCVACSTDAMRWLFPYTRKPKKVIVNGIYTECFRFSATERENARNELGISGDTKVALNVGRCTAQKNQRFILDIAEMTRDEDIIYLIAGDGELRGALEKECRRRGLDNVRMLGTRHDVPRLMWAADIFLFPSGFEGLSIAAIEAQSAGLPTLVSAAIAEETDIGTKLLIKKSSKNHRAAREWRNIILRTSADTPGKRISLSEEASLSGYDARHTTALIEELYNLAADK